MEKKVSTSPVEKAPNMSMPASKAPNMPMPKQPTMVMPVKHENKPVDNMEMKKMCHEHMHRYVLVQTHDGWCCDGIVEHLDDECVCIAVPHCGHMDRAFFPHGGFFPYPPIYPYPYFPRRRFIRQVFPLGSLLGLSLLPFY
ncbi:hypothetical protein [Paenibacillus silvisoli]|uniref:hypothetical protein n=1 Tax=Paenibacillus silvisoli TaxID=3110539 RepID=UPI002803EDE1|nr:hypothetical protein [Paenibacillus silvisoli]